MNKNKVAFGVLTGIGIFMIAFGLLFIVVFGTDPRYELVRTQNSIFLIIIIIAGGSIMVKGYTYLLKDKKHSAMKEGWNG
jgi:membrane-bound ClpP family serine protease